MGRDSGRRQLMDTLFSDPRRRQVYEAGEVIMAQGERNTRLFMVCSGILVGSRDLEDGESIPVLSFAHGELVGIQSIFLNDFVSTLTIRAQIKSELAWIDLIHDRPEDLEKRIIPLLVRALLKRQEQSLQQAERERIEALRAKELEQMGFLGQMAAAVAHELNNALAVVARGGEWLGAEVEHLAESRPPAEAKAFALGWREGRPLIGREQLRERTQDLRRRGFDFASARQIAQIDPQGVLLPLLHRSGAQDISAALRAWELGATLRDMAVSSRQAAHVVTALKQLGASERLREERAVIDETIKAAVTILGNKLRGVDLVCELSCTGTMGANEGELIQIWSNLISNACEAMASNDRPAQLRIVSSCDGGVAQVLIIDNGPGIPADVRNRIFEPNVTTKKAGLSFGLGLGLAVVRRLITLYHGSISVDSSPEGSTFRVRLPCQEA
ncbi:MAG: hypothetical protein EA402_05315 [Planctomycetota bacterium]|nr:MAG: hypothetical protein EA402_05315 [Planctomycetota bacterium]